ncbi:hypothetical protein CPC08DRAFT_604609, partial [Agrocybe pediades]
PPHPSLPAPPSTSTSYPQSYYNSHYVQAYAQPQAQLNPTITPIPTKTHSAPPPIWYQPGHNRCTHPGCSFTGSRKTVEIHMMDRHLIYPPGWDKKKKKPDWDADPSLKGKPIPIQGTNVILDTPEVLAAWIAERKRRFPTAAKVEEKKRKMEEAVARGQLDVNDSGRPNKRRNVDHSSTASSQKPNTNQRRNKTVQRAERETEQRVPDAGWPKKARIQEPLPPRPKAPTPFESDSESGSDNDQPEAISSKVVPSVEQLPADDRIDTICTTQVQEVPTPKITPSERHTRKKGPVQPKLPPRNPFASRPTLLRNLLLPEIRVTISNVSQAIRFLVDNDFLRDVELKPGEAEEGKKIQVV